ncbi:MAG: Methyltransferase type 11 [Solirubrobacterales bacterium]|nr:Methyltransferase type 11 [Solirubrobacterales bacterium]
MTLQSMGREPRAGDEIDARIAALAPWFHNLHLPSGHQTAPDHPLGDFPSFKWEQIGPHIPADLRGRRALDIGCNAGYYSFQLAARGASVLAVDMDEHYLEQGRWAAERLDPDGRVDFRRMQVYDLVDVAESFDLVLFLGVLYHLRYPLLALDLVAERTAGTLILQTLTMPGAAPADPPDDLGIDEREALTAPGWPRAAFIEGRLAGDPTNWWAADDACVQAMVRSAGMRVTATPAHEIYVCERDPEHDHAEPFRTVELRAATRR